MNNVINVKGKRSLELRRQEYVPGALSLICFNDDDSQQWSIRFSGVLEYRRISYDHSFRTHLAKVRDPIATLTNSELLSSYSEGHPSGIRDDILHYVIFMYDDVFEVLAKTIEFDPCEPRADC